MKWRVLYAIEREEVIEGDNINDAMDTAKQKRKEGERIVRIGTSGY